MAQKIVDYKCSNANAVGISEAISTALNLQFPQCYYDADTIVAMSLAVKEAEGSLFCRLPFCHTVEAEGLGGMINLNDIKYGPRASGYAYHSLRELTDLPPLALNQGRAGEILKACRKLNNQGERVEFEVSGFLTILSSLIDLTVVFKAWRKDPEIIDQIFEFLSDNIYRFIVEAKNNGAAVVSYADPAGGVKITGPKYAEAIAVKHTLPLLRRINALADENFILHLCPKTSWILTSLNLAEKSILDLGNRISYEEATLKALGKGKIIGQACLKNASIMLNHGKLFCFEI